MTKDTEIAISSLYEISQLAAKAKGLNDLWEPLFEKITKTMAVDAGTLMIIENESLVRKVAFGIDQAVLKEPPLDRAKGGYSWMAINQKKPLLVEKLEPDRIASATVKKENFHSLISVPLVSRGKAIGVMSLFMRRERHFTENDLNLFATIASQAATAIISIQATNLLESNQKRLRELEALNELSRSINSLFNFDETLFSIIGLIARYFNSSRAFISLFNHDDHLIHAVKPAAGLTDRQINDLRTRNDEGVTGKAFCKGIPVLANIIDDETNEMLARANIRDVKSILAAPLKVKSQTLGVFHILSSREMHFNHEEIEFFSILASSAAIVFDAAKTFKENEEERKKDEALLASLGEGVCAVDQMGKIILFNPAAEKLTGYLAEEVIKKDYIDVLAFYEKKGEEFELGGCSAKPVLADGKAQTCDQVYLRKRNGEFFPAQALIEPIEDNNNAVSGSIIAFRDVSKELETERLKQELVSIATHELRAPITAMKGYFEMVLGGDTGEVPVKAKETLEEMQAINVRLADLVDDLLNVGRIEEGRIEINPVSFDINSIIKEVIETFKIEAEKKNLELIFNPDPKIRVMADPERTRQVLVNLLSNAIKYTQKGSIELILSSDDSKVEVQVKDTGFGMTKDQMVKLFEKFYRVKTDQTRGIAGTGLGLWITKKLVQMMGGEIDAQSELGKGTTIRFNLPVGI